jgi:hypothetical protein
MGTITGGVGAGLPLIGWIVFLGGPIVTGYEQTGGRDGW